MLSARFYPDLPTWLNEQYPFSTRTLDLDGVSMSFVEEGEETASPLILVHGNPTWSFIWRKIIPAMSSRFRVIAPDLVGFGLSDKPPEAYHSLDRHIRDFTALIKATGATGLTLVLQEWGVPIGLGYATRFPENVKRIILLNSFMFPASSGQSAVLPWRLRLFRRSVGEFLIRRWNCLISPGMQFGTKTRLSAEAVSGYQFPFRESKDRAAMVSFMRMIPEQWTVAGTGEIAEIVSKLRDLPAEVEIVWGCRDPILRGKLPPYMLRDVFTNSREPVFVENSGHFVAEDAPDVLRSKLLEPYTPRVLKAQPIFNILK